MKERREKEAKTKSVKEAADELANASTHANTTRKKPKQAASTNRIPNQ